MSKVQITPLIDDASVGKGSVLRELWNASTETWDEYPASIGVDIGASVRLTATVTGDPDTDFFVGWFFEGLGNVNATSPWVVTATEGLTYTAKFGGTAEVKTPSARVGERPGAVVENAVAGACDPLLIVPAPAGTYQFVYGETVRLVATGGTNAHFAGWYDVYSALEQSVQRHDLSANCTITPTASFSIIAVFSYSPMTFYVRMTNSGATNYGALQFSTASVDVVEITKEVYDAALVARYGEIPDPDPGGPTSLPYIDETNTGLDRYIAMSGPDACTIRVDLLTDTITFLRWQIAQLNPGDVSGWVVGTPDDLATTKQAILNIASDCVIYASYNSGEASTVVADFATESNAAMGALSLMPAGGEYAPGPPVQARYYQGNTVTAIARALNGYKFVAWYYEGGALASSVAEFSFPIESGGSTIKLYAQFAQDDNAIYEWEGDDASKELEWRSRRYAAPVPFNPSCGRIMADGYPVTLMVHMSSSPDAPTETTRQVTIALPSQNGTRLPIVRPEKYIEVTVKSVHPVLHAAISTSMEGLADE